MTINNPNFMWYAVSEQFIEAGFNSRAAADNWCKGRGFETLHRSEVSQRFPEFSADYQPTDKGLS